MKEILAGLVASAALATPLAAQTVRPMLDYRSAATIRDACIAWATERNLSMAIAVFDERGTLLAFAQMDGAPTAVGEYAKWKGRSAATIHFPSSETANWGSGPSELATWAGGVPAFSQTGVPLGGVGVSGAESDDDVACGKAGIAAAGLRDAAN